jgi:hypothetical protein
MINRAREAFKHGADSENLVVDNVCGEQVVGNPLGVQYKALAGESTEDIGSLKSSAQRQEAEPQQPHVEVQQLTSQIQRLEAEKDENNAAIEWFLDLRNRFVSTYKRDKLE